ncbi:MAG: branched-chain amino acid ABC transporter permease [Pseudomonadota bacterium]|nr:branched-chain amino acid ABC transporter permease [Pseudomonadota bacterium]
MDIFLQQLVNGLVQGSIYALVALGYTMVYGIIELVNFAHGEVVMVGALVSLSVIQRLADRGLSGWGVIAAGILVSIPACMALGFAIERVAYRPLRRAPRLAPLISAIGVSIALQQLAALIWGRNFLHYPEVVARTPFHLGGAVITEVQLVILATAALLMAGLWFLVQRTRLGRAMRATAQNPAVAGLMGVDVDRIIATTFLIGSALAAVAGTLVGTYYNVGNHTMGFLLGMKAFTAAVLGGIGNLQGAMLGGLLLGVIENLGAGYLGNLTGGVIGSNYSDVLSFLMLVAVLVLRPSGLLGERSAEKV